MSDMHMRIAKIAQRVAAMFFFCISSVAFGEVVELIDGTMVWRQFVDPSVLELAKDPALRSSSTLGHLSATTMSAAAASQAPTQAPPGNYVPQEQHNAFSIYGGIMVSSQSGSYRLEETDLVLPGLAGYDFPLSRRYDPGTAKDDQVPGTQWNNWKIGDGSYSMGHGWRLNLPSLRVRNDAGTRNWGDTSNPREALIRVSLPSGASYSLADIAYRAGTTAPRVYENFYSLYFRFVVDESQTHPYRLVMNDGTYYVFDTDGRVREIHGWSDGRRADTITITYSNGKISTVTGSSDWSATFSYSGTPALISGITVSSGASPNITVTYNRTGSRLDGVTVVGGSGGEQVSRTWSYGYNSVTLNERKDGTVTSKTFQYVSVSTDPNGSVATITGTQKSQFLLNNAATPDYAERLLVTELQHQERMFDAARIRQLVPTKRTRYEYDEIAVEPHTGQSFIQLVKETTTDLIDNRSMLTEIQYAGGFAPGAWASVDNPLHWSRTRDPDNPNIDFMEREEYDRDGFQRVWKQTREHSVYLREFTTYYYDDYGNETYTETNRESALGPSHASVLRTWTRYWGATYPHEGTLLDVSVANGYPAEAAWRVYPYSPTYPTGPTNWYLPVNLPVQRIVGSTVPSYNGSAVTLNALDRNAYEYRHSAMQYDSAARLIRSGEYAGAPYYWLTTAYEYRPGDALNRVERMTSPGGLVTSYVYRAPSSGVYVVETTVHDSANVLDGETASHSVTTKGAHDTLTMTPVWTMDGRGYVTEYGLDAFGRTTRMVLPDVNEGNDVTFAEPGTGPFSTHRGDNPVVSWEINDTELWSEVTDPLGRKTRTYYSSFGAVEQVIRYAASGNVVVDIEYNGSGLPIRRTGAPNGIAGSLTMRPVTTFIYDFLGNPTSMVHPDGAIARQERDYRFGVVTHTNERGFQRDEHYSIDGVVLKTVEYLDLARTQSRTHETHHDGLGNERFTVDALGHVTHYDYNDLAQLERVTYPRDTTTPFFEDGAFVAGNSAPYERFVYNRDGHQTARIVSDVGGTEYRTDTVVDGLGRTIRSDVPYTDVDLGAGGMTTNRIAVTTQVYDATGNVISIVDPRYHGVPDPPAMRYVHSPQGAVLAETDPEGNTRTIRYYADGQIERQVDPRGAAGLYPGFAGDFVTTFFYDELGRLERTQQQLAADGITRPEILRTYYPAGNVRSTTSAEGALQTVEYTPRGQVSRIQVEGDGRIYTTTHAYDPAGNEIQRVTPGGAVTSTEYDGWNRIVKVISPETMVSTFTYDVRDNVTATYDGNGISTTYTYNVYGKAHEITLAANSTHQSPETTRYWYDRRGRVTRMLDPINRELRYRYDERGARLEQYEVALGSRYRFSYDPAGAVEEALDPNGTLSTYTYDAAGRPTTVAMINGAETKTTTHAYDEAGFRYRTDDDGVVTEYNVADGTYTPDPYGRINSETTTMVGEQYTVSYTYNRDGRATSVTSPSGHASIYRYNSLGEILRVPGFIDVDTRYNAQGRRELTRLVNGIDVQWDYDLDGRLVEKHDSATSGTVGRWRFVYDNASNVIWKNDIYYEYDDVNRLTREVRNEFLTAAAEATTGSVYDDLFGDRPLEFQIGPGAVSLDYNAGSVGADLGFSNTIERIVLSPAAPVHRVQGDYLRVYIADATEAYTEVTGWHARVLQDGSIEIAFDGPPPTARYVKVHATFDERAADLTPVDASEFANLPGDIITVYASATVHAEEGFVYDAAGNRAQEIDIITGVVHASTYYGNDQSQRLKSNGASGDNGRFAFVYDGNGNMTARGTHYTEPTPDQIAIDTTMGKSWTYAWDLANRLTGVSRNGTTVAHYTYSGRGLRVRKAGTSGTVVTIFDQWGRAVYERRGSTYRDYVYAHGYRLGRIDGTIDGAGVHTETARYWYHTDHLGTVEAVTDGTGATVWEATYSAFGEVLSQTGTLEQEPLYTVKSWDADIESYYYNARWYDPELGRFINEDPARDGLNWYAYVENNPLMYSDPTGLRRELRE